MSLTKYKFKNPEGAVISSGSWRHSCTGVFQYSQNGQYAAQSAFERGATDLEQTFHSGDHPIQNQKFMEALENIPMLQALVPGLSYVENASDYEMVFNFPSVNTLPSDQVITAMRFIKAWLCTSHSYQVHARGLREYELDTNLMAILGAFTTIHDYESDFYPLITVATRSHFEEAFDKSKSKWKEMDDHRRSFFSPTDHYSQYLKREKPTAGMILALVRGQINQGLQPNIGEGYLKEGNLVADWSRDRNHYQGSERIKAYGPNDCLTVNHPIIILNDETAQGPKLSSSRDQAAVVEWVLTQVGL